MKVPRVLLADDHTLLAEAFRKLLEPQCEVVGTVADGRALDRGSGLHINIEQEPVPSACEGLILWHISRKRFPSDSYDSSRPA